MKARLAPVYFPTGRDAEFDTQLESLKLLLADEAEFLDPVPLGSALPPADAALFPQLIGEGYRQLAAFREIKLPILIATSEFGTMSMWDWELSSYLAAEGVDALAPYNLEQTRAVCRALSVKRELQETTFLVYQDNPGEGFQAGIFNRFYWWEDECTERMARKFGVRIVKKSFKTLAEQAKQIPDAEAETVRNSGQVSTTGVSPRALSSAIKLYLAVKRELASDPGIRAVGINCLNESHFSDTTPCLAWNLLYEERGLIWGCEADTMSMLTKFILHRSLGVPIMMTNLYPFLMGQAALKHEHIDKFPDLPEPDNCVLVAHCGYLGVLPVSFASEWTLRSKVLAIVDDNATAIDARLPEGDITLAKLGPALDTLAVSEGKLEGYAQYPESHCRNGGIIRVPDGHKLMSKLPSHHCLLMTGHHRAEIENLARVFHLAIEQI